MDRGLKDLRAVIIGGTKGIGCSTANILAAEGCHVSVCARNKDEVVMIRIRRRLKNSLQTMPRN